MKTYFFMIVMCVLSALILSIVATSLEKPQIASRDSYRNRELLKAASLLPPKASQKQVETITKEYITPMLTDKNGMSYTFEKKNINLATYLEEGAKKGYYSQELKLYYQIKEGGIILPVNGFGLWDAIYGYIGIANDGSTILGISWYDQKETPGLGAEIEDPSWQKLFVGKSLFHGESNKGFGLNFAPKVMIASLPASDRKYTIDAISGATITTTGVQNAIKTSLSPYIPLLKKLAKK